MKRTLLAAACAALVLHGPAAAQDAYRTEKVVIAVMDGVHYGLTFGDPDHAHIPHLWNELRPQGTYYTNFYNNAVTITMAGHSQIMTGVWQYNRNRGALQTYPTVIHYMADEQGLAEGEAAVVFGKGYYAYQPETTFPSYEGLYEPTFVRGIGEVTYQDDWATLERVRQVMRDDSPRLIFANFGTPDHTAHAGNWERHVGAVENADRVLGELWSAIQSDPEYRDRTTLIITNDHGYQDPGVHDGFAEHGDQSHGSRHVMLLMLGPDIRRNHVVDDPAYHIDIAPTVGELLGFQTPLADGEVLRESLVEYRGVNRKEAVTPRAEGALAIEALAGGNALRHLADRVLQERGEVEAMSPSVPTSVLLWGMLHAYDRTGDRRYLDLVRAWVEAHSDAAGETAAHLGFVASQLSYREMGSRREELAALALPLAREAVAALERGPAVKEDVPDFILRLVLAASVAEMSREEALWHRARALYLDHVRRFDEARVEAYVTQGGDRRMADADREIVVAGKILPDVVPTGAPPDQPWYLLGIAHLRGHGLPFKGEYLDDLPLMAEEVLYQTYLAVDQLPFPGSIWEDPQAAALSVAGIREVNRRLTFRGGVYERMDRLSQDDVAALRPETAAIVPRLDDLRERVATRVSTTNYNVKYGFPEYEDFDFTVDLLRLYLEEADDPLTTGAFLMALDEHRRISREPFVASPR